MTTIPSSNHRLERTSVRGAEVIEPAPDVPSATPSPAQDLGAVLLGVLLLLLGSALILTLWLLPVGLPLALLGLALIVAPSDPWPS